MPNTENRAAGLAATVSPYHLTEQSRETLKRRAEEIRWDLAQRRVRRAALVNWQQVNKPCPQRAAQWPEGCTHLPTAPAQVVA